MAQLYNLDSGLLDHQGKTDAEYLDRDDYDPNIHGITYVTQVFPDPWEQIPFFYVASLNAYFEFEYGYHPLTVAAKTLFTPTRWEEIEEALEEQGNFEHHLGKLNMKKIRKLIDKAERKTLITNGERTLLFSVYVDL